MAIWSGASTGNTSGVYRARIGDKDIAEMERPRRGTEPKMP
jgi:hypothetical protein